MNSIEIKAFTELIKSEIELHNILKNYDFAGDWFDEIISFIFYELQSVIATRNFQKNDNLIIIKRDLRDVITNSFTVENGKTLGIFHQFAELCVDIFLRYYQSSKWDFEKNPLSIKSLNTCTSLNVTTIVSDECSICNNPISMSSIERIINKCDHKYHAKCIDEWFENYSNCPFCKIDLSS